MAKYHKNQDGSYLNFFNTKHGSRVVVVIKILNTALRRIEDYLPYKFYLHKYAVSWRETRYGARHDMVCNTSGIEDLTLRPGETMFVQLLVKNILDPVTRHPKGPEKLHRIFPP